MADFLNTVKADEQLYYKEVIGVEDGVMVEMTVSLQDKDKNTLCSYKTEDTVLDKKLKIPFKIDTIAKENNVEIMKVAFAVVQVDVDEELVNEPSRSVRLKVVQEKILRSVLLKNVDTFNAIAAKKISKTYALQTKDKDIRPIKKALNNLNLNIVQLHTNDIVYNEDVKATVELFQRVYIPPKEQLHPYNTPLKIDGEVSDQTLMAMDEALVNNVKFNDPQVIHFDGRHLSFVDNTTGELHICDGTHLHIDGDHLCYKQDTQNDSSLDAIDLSGYAVGTTGTMQATAQAYYETLSRQQKHKLAEKMKRTVSRAGKPEVIKTATIKSVAGSALSNSTAKGLGLLSVGVIIFDVADDNEIRASHVLNLAMVGVSTIPVVGWIIGGTYFLADITTLAISGKNIGGYLDDAVNNPLYEFE